MTRRERYALTDHVWRALGAPACRPHLLAPRSLPHTYQEPNQKASK